jgi:hypothetical protein
MGQQTGSTVKLVYDTETVYKTNPTPDGMILPFVSESIRLTRDMVSSKTIRNSRNPSMPVRQRMNVAGDINFELSPAYGRLFSHIFSAGVRTLTGPYLWTYKVGTLPVGMLIEKQFPDLDAAKYVVYNGCKVQSFKCSSKVDGFIDCSVSLVGAKETINASVYDATVTDLAHIPFDGYEATLKQGGNPLSGATAFDFTLENGLDDSIFAIGDSGERSALREGIAKVTGKLTLFFANHTLYLLAIAATETTLQITFTHGTGAGTAGNEKLEIYFPEVKLGVMSPVVSGPTGMLLEVPFEAYYDNDASASAAYALLTVPQSAF